MRILRILPLLAVCVSLGLVTPGCSSEEKDEGLKYEPKKDGGQVDTSTDTGPTCDPAALCTRSITECKAELTQTDCEKWYVEGECKDMTAYTSCNCNCIGKSTCDEYFACGEICFTDHCK